MHFIFIAYPQFFKPVACLKGFLDHDLLTKFAVLSVKPITTRKAIKLYKYAYFEAITSQVTCFSNPIFSAFFSRTDQENWLISKYNFPKLSSKHIPFIFIKTSNTATCLNNCLRLICTWRNAYSQEQKIFSLLLAWNIPYTWCLREHFKKDTRSSPKKHYTTDLPDSLLSDLKKFWACNNPKLAHEHSLTDASENVHCH